MPLKAQVFISCGQRKNTNEVYIAEQIAARLREKGFDPYIAVQQQSLDGLKENIFRELSLSEYFIFIDFKREKIADSDEYRGSLFCHQELAIASFLNMPLIGFQEARVKKDDGILRFLQANCTPFTDYHTLSNVVADMVEQKGWKANWKNQLVMERNTDQHEDVLRLPENKKARFFHITVRNLNPYKHAKNCYAFLEKIQDLSTNETISVRSVEFKWAGYILPNATILPDSHRLIDGLFVFHDAPAVPRFNIYTDSGHFVPVIKSPGGFHLTYIVISDNFETVKSTFHLELSNNLNELIFENI